MIDEMNKKDNSIKLFCFTPLVTLLTFFIELIFAIYVIIKYRMSLFGRLSALLLFLLAFFQLSEFIICKGAYPLIWAEIAYLSTIFMPIIGIHLISLVTKKNIWTKIGYFFAIVISLIILFVPNIFVGTSCPGNFVVFNLASFFSSIYFFYYSIFLLIGILMIFFYKIDIKNKKNKIINWLLIGYASFIVPTFLIYVFEKITRLAVASILCGFAVLLAFILVFKILPEYKKFQNNKRKK